MYITDLKKERKLMHSVYVDGEFWAKINNEILAQNGVKIGLEIEDNFLNKLKLDSDYKNAKNKALYLLSIKDYTKKELFDKLKKFFCIEAVEKTIEKMEDLGLVNDQIFAHKYAKYLIFNKYFSKNRAAFEMRKRRLSKEIISATLLDIEYDEKEHIKFLIDKKYKNAYFDQKIKDNAIAFLQRYGYNWNDIKSFFDEYR